MSGFFGSSDATRWGGLLKQAISNVETTFDTLLDQQNAVNGNNIRQQQHQQGKEGDDSETDLETYVDPVSGAVTTVRRPKRKTTEKPTIQSAPASPKQSQQRHQQQQQPRKSSTPTPGIEHHRKGPERTSSDLATRLAAVMNEKHRQSQSPELKPQQNGKQSPAITNTPTTTTATAADATATAAVVTSNVPSSPNAAAESKDRQEQEEEKEEAGKEGPAAVAEDDNTGNDKNMQKDEIEKEKDDARVVSAVEDLPAATKVETSGKTKDDVTDASANDVADTSNKSAEEDKATVEEAAVVGGMTSKPDEKTDQEATKLSTTAKDDKDSILQQREVQLLQAMQTIAGLHDQIQTLQEQNEKGRKDGERRIKELLSQQQQQQHHQSGGGGVDQRQIKKLESTIEDLRQQVNNKNEQIQGLMDEGEKLSKIELKHTTAIKRLRAEKHDQEKILAELQRKIEKTSSDLVEANGKLIKANETEKRLNETVKMLSDMTERQTKHINKLETDILGLREQKNKTEAKLLEAKENLEAERERIHAESKKAHAAILEKEVNAASKLREELKETEKNAEEQEQRLRGQVHELQTALQSTQSEAGSREDGLRNEIAELQRRLRQAESGTEDVDTIVAEATSSLLLQIETLQTQHSLAMKNRDHSEHGIVVRLQTAETERDEAKNELDGLRQSLAEMTLKLEQVEQGLTQEKLQSEKQHAEYEAEHATAAKQAEEISQLHAHIQQYKAREQELENTIKARYQKLMKERLQEEKRLWEQKVKADRAKPVRTVPVRPSESEGSSCDSPPSEPSGYPKFTTSNSPATSPRSSVDTASYSGIGANTSISNNFTHTNVRHLENQLSFYQTQLQSTMQSRDELSDEVMTLTVEIEKLRKDNSKLQGLEKQLRDLEERQEEIYHASLELLGERTEQVEELKADIADVKEMYRNQIVELVQNMGK